MTAPPKPLSRRAFLRVLASTGAAAAFVRIANGALAATAEPIQADHVKETIAAAIDVLFPKTPGLPHSTGAVEVHVEDFVIQALDSYLAAAPTQKQGVPMSAAVVAILDAYAMQVTPGKRFVDQTTDERILTFAAMDASPDGDVRFIAFALPGMASLGFYTEWYACGTRYEGDHDNLDLSKLPVWSEIGFEGPEDVFPAYMYPYDPGSPIEPTSPAIP